MGSSCICIHVCAISGKNEIGVMKMKEKRIILPPLPLMNDGIGKIPMPIITDPNGSYTGRPADPEDRPIQDADDL